MKINNDNSIPSPHSTPAASGVTSSAGQPANASASASASASAPAPTTNAAAISTSSTTNLIDLVAASTDVRDDVVANIKIRLAEGEFATQQAAYEAAEAILNI